MKGFINLYQREDNGRILAEYADTLEEANAKAGPSRVAVVDLGKLSLKAELLTQVEDNFIIPLANQYVDKGNSMNIVHLCRRAHDYLETGSIRKLPLCLSCGNPMPANTAHMCFGRLMLAPMKLDTGIARGLKLDSFLRGADEEDYGGKQGA